MVHYHGLVKLADYRLTVGDCKPVGLSFYTDEFKLLGLNIFSETV
ncbi:unnamed protein product [Trichobilharzia regenti]|nr:unnamed protein product [Trichobilharzia regenti]